MERLIGLISRRGQKKANELAMIEAMNFFLKMHEGRMQDEHGITWYVRETGNALKAVNDLIREAGFLMKYHSAFSKAYADRAACIEEKIFNKKDAKGENCC